MKIPDKYRNFLLMAWQIFRYNQKIIFGNKFLYFLFAAFVFFVLVVIINLVNREVPSESGIYNILLLPGLLLVFYPTAYGIQGDVDSRTIETLFGIPNYRYKVWLIRVAIVFVLASIILLLLSILSYYTLYNIRIFNMTYQLLFPVVFMGCLTFMFSTVFKTGNGTAVVMVIIGITIWILSDFLSESEWNVFFNPFKIQTNINEIIYSQKLIRNRVYLSSGVILTLLYALFNLQHREKFMR